MPIECTQALRVRTSISRVTCPHAPSCSAAAAEPISESRPLALGKPTTPYVASPSNHQSPCPSLRFPQNWLATTRIQEPLFARRASSMSSRGNLHDHLPRPRLPMALAHLVTVTLFTEQWLQYARDVVAGHSSLNEAIFTAPLAQAGPRLLQRRPPAFQFTSTPAWLYISPAPIWSEPNPFLSLFHHLQPPRPLRLHPLQLLNQNFSIQPPQTPLAPSQRWVPLATRQTPTARLARAEVFATRPPWPSPLTPQTSRLLRAVVPCLLLLSRLHA